MLTDRRTKILEKKGLKWTPYLNKILNDTVQKMLWEEAVHTCKHVRNSMVKKSVYI